MDLFPCQTSQVKVATAASPEDKTLGPIVGYLVKQTESMDRVWCLVPLFPPATHEVLFMELAVMTPDLLL